MNTRTQFYSGIDTQTKNRPRIDNKTKSSALQTIFNSIRVLVRAATVMLVQFSCLDIKASREILSKESLTLREFLNTQWNYKFQH